MFYSGVIFQIKLNSLAIKYLEAICNVKKHEPKVVQWNAASNAAGAGCVAST